VSTFENQPWHALPPETASVILPEIASLRDEIIHAISQEVPEYARPLEGAFGRGIERGVEEALRQFVNLIEDPRRGRAQSREVYRALGRGEMRAGRGLDVLQAAYRIGARATWRRLAAAGLRAGLEAPVLCSLADSIFAYIHELAADSVDGFADAQRQAAGEREGRRHQLLVLLLAEPLDHEAVREAALNAQWRLPRALAALACQADDLEAITRRLPHDALGGTIEDQGCILIPDAAAPGRTRVIAAAGAGRTASLGPMGPPAGAASSWRRARSALEAMQLGALPAGFCRADEHLAAIATLQAREPLRELARLRLAPLWQLTPTSRVRMTATLRAYLEQRGSTPAMAEALELHPQTVRYRMRRLRELFGEALDDPDARFELQAVLRLPQGMSAND
jgi:PucR C-terminal helix-turn-helix domain